MASTGNITASEDAQIASANPTTNYGSVTMTIVGVSSSGDKFRGLYKFNVTVPADVVIDSATLSITTNDNYFGSPAVTGVYPVTDNSWTEGGVNWSNQPTAGALIQSFSTSYLDGTVNYDVTNFVASELGAGGSIPISFMQKTTNEAIQQGLRWRSRENAGTKPTLIVNYSPRPPISVGMMSLFF